MIAGAHRVFHCILPDLVRPGAPVLDGSRIHNKTASSHAFEDGSGNTKTRERERDWRFLCVEDLHATQRTNYFDAVGSAVVSAVVSEYENEKYSDSVDISTR